MSNHNQSRSERARKAIRDFWLDEEITLLDGSLDKFKISGYKSRGAYIRKRRKEIEKRGTE